MTYLLVLGAIVLFGAGVFVGTRFGVTAQKKLAAIDREIRSVKATLGYEAQRLVDNIKSHL